MSDLKAILEYINTLEKRIHVLENQEDKIVSSHQFGEPKDKKELSSKMQARLELMQTIRMMYPGLFVTVAKRSDGGGLLLTSKTTHKNYTLKFYRSKNYSSNRLFAWFSVRSKDVFEQSFDFYAMSVCFANKNHSFLFDYETLLHFIQQKKTMQREKHGQNNNEDIIHFYIEDQHGRYVDTREINQTLDKDRGMLAGGIDVTTSHHNFQIIEEKTQASHQVNDQVIKTTNALVIRNMIDEIMHQQFLIGLKRNDYIYGEPLLYIEFQEGDVIHIDEINMKSLKKVILHIETHYEQSLVVIDHFKSNIVPRIEDVPLLISVSLKEEKTTKAKLIFYGGYSIE